MPIHWNVTPDQIEPNEEIWSWRCPNCDAPGTMYWWRKSAWSAAGANALFVEDFCSLLCAVTWELRGGRGE